MRISMLTVGSRGDVQPLVAFGRALQDAGHAVRICAQPEFEDFVTRRGLVDFAPLAAGALSRGNETEEGRRWAQRGSRWLPTWVGLLQDARSVAPQRLRDAAAGTVDADVIVATNLTQVLGWQLARERGVPLVRTLLNAPAYWMSRRTSRPAAAALRQAAWLAARPWLNSVRAEALGLPPLPRREPIGALDRQRQLVLYPFSRAVFPEPAGWGGWTEVTGYWFLDTAVDPDPSDELRAFLAAGPPPVCLGFGTQLDPDPAATTSALVDAVRDAGLRGVLLRPPEALAGVDLGDDVIAVQRVAHDWLFPRCAAIVHHGAAGTTATALRSGVPSVVVPHNTDQFTWARRLAELRVSPPPIPRRKLSAERLRPAILGATSSPLIRERTRALAERIRAEDGVARAVAAFERRFGTAAKSTPARRRPPTAVAGGSQ
jgi:UDP:flavonoid glycosyltransferase YjiC (YdhE family)